MPPFTLPGRPDNLQDLIAGLNMPVTLANGKQGEHTGGYRFGRWTEIRDYYHEEVEKALQGKQSAKEAIDNTIKRGNAALRAFEKTAATN